MNQNSHQPSASKHVPFRKRPWGVRSKLRWHKSCLLWELLVCIILAVLAYGIAEHVGASPFRATIISIVIAVFGASPLFYIWPFVEESELSSLRPIRRYKWPKPDTRLRGAYRELIARIDLHKSGCLRGAGTSYRLGKFLVLAIPIISAMVTFLSASARVSSPIIAPSVSDWLVPSASLLLTLLAIVNSAFMPDYAYRVFSKALIELHDLEYGLHLDAQKFKDDAASTDQLKTLLTAKNSELTEIGKGLLEVWTPGPTHSATSSSGTCQPRPSESRSGDGPSGSSQ